MSSTASTTPATAKPTSRKPPATPAPTPPAKPAKAPALKTPVNVYVLLMRGSDFVAHNTNCKQYKSLKAKSEYKGLDDYEIEGVLNQRDVIMDAWDDQIRETWTPEDGDDYAQASWSWLAKNGYVGATAFHSCLNGLPQSSKAAAAKNTEAVKKATKQELATRVALAAAAMLDTVFSDFDTDDKEAVAFNAALLAAFGDEASARQCVAQWLHGMPVDRDRWYASGLPIPQRSDWADYQPPATEEATEDKPAA